METGTPYMLFKVCMVFAQFKFKDSIVIFSFLLLLQDTCNRKSNQQNLGTIKSSNLCTEIIEFTSPDETAVCNLASIALPRFVRENVNKFVVIFSIYLNRNLLFYDCVGSSFGVATIKACRKHRIKETIF